MRDPSRFFTQDGGFRRANGSFMEWFTAVRKRLAAHGLRPYPHTVRTLKGSGLATLLALAVFLLAYSGWKVALYTTRHMQRTVFVTIEHSATASILATEQAEQAMYSLFPSTRPVTEASLESILPPGSHLGNQMRAPLQQNTLPFQEGTGTLTDAARQVDFALIQTVIRLGLDRRVLLLTSDYHSRDRDIYHHQRMRLYLPPVEQAPSAPSPASPDGGEIKGPPEPVFRFMNALAESLDTWADRAVLTESPGKLTLAAKGVMTHEIWFETTKEPLQPLSDKSPRMTIVMNEMGRDKASAASLLSMNIPLTFAVLPFAPDAAQVASAVHAAGQEVLVDMPLEPMQSPFVKAGPGEITSGMSSEEMRLMLDDALGHVPYATGASNFMGSRLTGDKAATRRFCDMLARSGLYVLDDPTHQGSFLYSEARRRGLPAWRRTVTLNTGPKTESAVLDSLKQAEETARAKGYAVVIGNPDPQVLAALERWSRERDTSIRLVPLRTLPREEETLTPDDLPGQPKDPAVPGEH